MRTLPDAVWLAGGAALLLQTAFAAAPPGPGREKVLKQIRLPHHYYYREMYLPQATSGVASPVWSPDGKELAISLEGSLWRVDPATGAARQLTNGPGYDYQPDWSPDGRSLAYASYCDDAVELRTLEIATGRSAPLTENRAVNLEPRWARDGRRVVYASYLGRQWHQLWLMTADGGDAFPLTYGEFDATAPRWSPDGTRIAYVSNEGGIPSLWTIEVPGGQRRKVMIRDRQHLGPVGRLRIEVTEGEHRLPARVSVTGPDGRSFAPEGAWRHSDDYFDREERRIEYGYFHTAGASELVVPAGTVDVEVLHGLEYRPVRQQVEIPTGGVRELRVTLERMGNWPARGWWSGDLHVHMNYGGAYRATPAILRLQAEAEDVHAVFDLIVNKEQRIPDIASFAGRPDPLSTPETLIRHDQEFHTSFWGHTSLLGLTDHALLPGYAGYVNTAAASLHPTNAVVADRARAQGALVGYVHSFDAVPDPHRAGDVAGYPIPGFDPGDPVALPVDAALGKVDFYEAVGFSVPLPTNAVWYRLLNCGFRLPAGAGTDAMTNYVSLRGPVGMNRVFVKAGPALDFEHFLEALKAGRSMATNGPLVELSLRPRSASDPWREPGDEISLLPGRHTLEARVSLRSIVPVDRLEIVGNGEVVAAIPLAGDRTTADTTVSLSVRASGWYLLRAWAERSRHPVLDFYPFGTTSPVYVTVGGRPMRSAGDARYFVAWIDRVRAAAQAYADWNTPAEKEGVLAMLERARGEFEARAGPRQSP